ncbi:unnamed protein product [Gordionus sp. m RMFG-2023]
MAEKENLQKIKKEDLINSIRYHQLKNNKTVEMAKSAWKNLRDCFMREHKNYRAKDSLLCRLMSCCVCRVAAALYCECSLISYIPLKHIAKALYSFKGKNNDELSFLKGDIITITQAPTLVCDKEINIYESDPKDWWEGSLSSKIGWFPCNYVEIIDNDESINNLDIYIHIKPSQTNISFHSMVIQNAVDHETNHVNDIHELLRKYLRPLHGAKIMTILEYYCILSNLEHIAIFHSKLLNLLKYVTESKIEHQRIGGLFLKTYPQISSLIKKYCSNHPSAMRIVIDVKRDGIQTYLNTLNNLQNVSQPSTKNVNIKKISEVEHWKKLCAGLSLPFRHLERYPTFLRELYRLLPENHVDRGDIQRAIELYCDLMVQLQDIRKQKEFELEIVTNSIEGWEGENIKALGHIVSITTASIISRSSENLNCDGFNQKDEKYFVLFPETLLIISPNFTLNGFLYEGKIPIAGLKTESIKVSENFNEDTTIIITGILIDPIIAQCNNIKEKDRFIENMSLLQAKNVSKMFDASVINQKNIENLVPKNNDDEGRIERLTYIKSGNITLKEINKPKQSSYVALSDSIQSDSKTITTKYHDNTANVSSSLNEISHQGPPPINISRKKLVPSLGNVMKPEEIASNKSHTQIQFSSPGGMKDKEDIYETFYMSSSSLTNTTLSPSPSFAIKDVANESTKYNILSVPNGKCFTSRHNNFVISNDILDSSIYEKSISISEPKVFYNQKVYNLSMISPLSPLRPKLMEVFPVQRSNIENLEDAQLLKIVETLNSDIENWDKNKFEDYWMNGNQSDTTYAIINKNSKDYDKHVVYQINSKIDRMYQRLENLECNMVLLRQSLETETLARLKLQIIVDEKLTDLIN